MTDVIDFLEKAGCDAQWRYMSQADIELALADAPFDPELKTAILAKDQRRLGSMLGYGVFCCAIMPGKDDDDGKDKDKDKDKDKEKKKDKGKSKGSKKPPSKGQ